MPRASQTIEFEGYFAEEFLGIFENIRCFENPRGMHYECA